MQIDVRRQLERILTAPTAPFFEDEVRNRLLAFAKQSSGLRARVDACGNVELVYGPGRPKLLFQAHMDHPAMLTNGQGTATARGGIRVEQLVGHGLVSLDGETRVEVSGVVRGKRSGTVKLRGARGLKRGIPLILDIPALKITKTHVRARAIDDLCSVAACVAAADRLRRARWKGTVGFLFTRAEEVGFIGAIGWVRTTKFPRSTTIINLETSRALRHTPLGEGPVIRVGDRTTTFHPDVTLLLQEAAGPLPHQRALMDGGNCEATIFAHAGFRAGALCLPTKNIHNHKPRGGMGHEYVHCDDVEHLVQLIVSFIRRQGELRPRAGLDRRFDAYWRRFEGDL